MTDPRLPGFERVRAAVRRAVGSDALRSLVLALAYFHVVWGLSAVDPGNLEWVFAVERDLTRALTGIAYYRTSAWSFPITAFDGMLFPVGTSVTIADGIPALAAVYKLLDPLLPERVYQYFGLWLFACVWLQALFAKRILATFDLPGPVQWLGVVLSTANLPQALAIWHAALWGHWTILAGFYLVLKRELPLRRAALLVFVVAWIHPYLLSMVLATVVAMFVKHRHTHRVAAKIAVVVSSLLISSWLVGYFAFPTGVAKAGDYQADLLALFNSGGTGLVPELFPLRDYDEGYAYLGLGGATLLGLLLLGALVPRFRVPGLHARPLLFVCVLMALYAFSSSPMILGHELGAIPLLTNLIEPVQSRLRCNGRFLWPLWQYIVLFGVGNAWRMLQGGRKAWVAVAAAFSLQVVDVGPWLAGISRPIPDPPAVVRMPSELEARLSERSRLLIFVPPVLRHPCSRATRWPGDGGTFWGAALFGAVHGLKTNSDFYALTRVSSADSKAVCAFTEKLRRSKSEHPEAIFVEPAE